MHTDCTSLSVWQLSALRGRYIGYLELHLKLTSSSTTAVCNTLTAVLVAEQLLTLLLDRVYVYW